MPSSECPATLNRSRRKRFFCLFVKINSRSMRHQSRCECFAELGVISSHICKMQWDGLQGGPCSEAVPAGSSEHTCGRCTLEKELLCLVTELWEEMSRLRSIRERDTHAECTLPFLRLPHRQAGRQDAWDGWLPIHSSPGWAQWLKARGNGNKFLPSAAGVSPLWLPHLHRSPGIALARYEALQVELNNNKDVESSG